ncbi:ribonuclease-III-like-domain-containing protein, partial [Coniella lustricola]
EESRPRWSYTPEAMKGRHGFSLNYIRKPQRAIWHVNEDPALLDEFYERFLGRNGAKMLPEELKWLAITHKSFDYGRRGFNTRLAFFGRQILVVEAMNAIMTRPMTVQPHLGDPWKREHFKSPALQNVDKLSVDRPQDLMSVESLARVGLKTQLDQVMRWKPRIPENLKSSGIEVVLSTTIFAIVGAVSLQHGGEVASRIAREKVLGRL